MKRLCLTVLLGASLCGADATAASISERTQYFTLRGSSLDQLDRELSRKGPFAGSSRHPGATQISFNGRVTYRSSDTACRIGGTSFELKIVKFLPRWQRPRSASPTTAIIWQTLEQDIARHEEDHAKIARSYLKRMETAVRNLDARSNCTALEKVVNATTARYLKEHEAAQRAFDAKEGREVGRRLQRLLKRNMDAAAATQ